MTLTNIIAVVLITYVVAFTTGLLIGQEETKKEMVKRRRQRLN